MKSRFFQCCVTFLAVILPASANLMAVPGPGVTYPPVAADDKDYAGKWVGTYSSDEGGAGNVTFILALDDKGQWKGSVTYTNQNGDQTAEIKALQVSGSKFKGMFGSPDGMEVTLEGEFLEGRFSGTYIVREKGTAEVAEKGTWKTAKN